MSTRTRREYLVILAERYRKAPSKLQRSQILNEGVTNTGLHRKSLIRALRDCALEVSPLPKLGRPRRYSSECVKWLIRLYRRSRYVCSVNLKAMLEMLIDQSPEPIPNELKAELLNMSPASIDRYLAKYRKLDRRRKNTGTRSGSKLFKRLVPLRNLSNVATKCGYLQADTVAHCGGRMNGEFVWSLTITDEFSGFTLNRAIFGRCAINVLPEIRAIHESLPFDLSYLNVDNGSEFLNGQVYEYFHRISCEKGSTLPMTWSRSYHKNDNAYAEQKNWMNVRQLFGYDRFEHKILVPFMNEIYKVEGLIRNFFIPQQKLKSKLRIGAKMKKKYHPPETPYARILKDPSVAETQKQKLREIYSSLNYYALDRRKEALLSDFLKMLGQLNSQKKTIAA